MVIVHTYVSLPEGIQCPSERKHPQLGSHLLTEQMRSSSCNCVSRKSFQAFSWQLHPLSVTKSHGKKSGITEKYYVSILYYTDIYIYIYVIIKHPRTGRYATTVDTILRSRSHVHHLSYFPLRSGVEAWSKDIWTLFDEIWYVKWSFQWNQQMSIFGMSKELPDNFVSSLDPSQPHGGSVTIPNIQCDANGFFSCIIPFENDQYWSLLCFFFKWGLMMFYDVLWCFMLVNDPNFCHGYEPWPFALPSVFPPRLRCSPAKKVILLCWTQLGHLRLAEVHLLVAAIGAMDIHWVSIFP